MEGNGQLLLKYVMLRTVFINCGYSSLIFTERKKDPPLLYIGSL